tara:strand:- start:1844 stop:2056 length:213 start_codon:yes stop_codon:yes gene_type:complete
MKLSIKDIKYVRQSLEYRADYYKDRPKYGQYLNEINQVIKKFIKLEGKHYKNIKSFNEKVSKKIEDKLKN